MTFTPSHAKHGCVTYVCSNVSDATRVNFTLVWHHSCGWIVDTTSPMSISLKQSKGAPLVLPCPALPHPAVMVGDFNSHHPDWWYQDIDQNWEFLLDWESRHNLLLLHDSKQCGTFHSARWERDFSPDLCWISTLGGYPQPVLCTIL